MDKPDHFHGAGKFVDEHTVEVALLSGTKLNLRGDKILVATGSSPVRPPEFPFQDERVCDSNQILNVKTLPRRLAVVGAGVIGSELEPQEIGLALLRGFFLGAGAAWAFAIDFGLLFGLLTVTALLLAYWLGFSPSHEFESLKRPHLSRRRLLGAFVLSILLALAAVLANWIKRVSAQPLDSGLRYGLVVGLLGLLFGTLSGFTEWYTDNLPERRLGLLGICLIICGVIIQSVQYWVSLLDVPLR